MISAAWAILSGLGPRFWEILGVCVAIAAFEGYIYHLGGVEPRKELDALQARFQAFQGQVRDLGEKAKAVAEAKDKANEQAKEQANAKLGKEIKDISTSWAADRAERDRLRKQLSDSRSRPVSKISVSTGLSCNATSNATISAAVSGYVEAARRAFDDCRTAANDFRDSVAEQLKAAELNTAALSCGITWAASIAKP